MVAQKCCLLRSSPCRPDDNNRLESSSKGHERGSKWRRIQSPSIRSMTSLPPHANARRTLTDYRKVDRREAGSKAARRIGRWLTVVICLSFRLSHASLSRSCVKYLFGSIKLNCVWLIKTVIIDLFYIIYTYFSLKNK